MRQKRYYQCCYLDKSLEPEYNVIILPSEIKNEKYPISQTASDQVKFSGNAYNGLKQLMLSLFVMVIL